jgi:phage terminase small subunit
MALTDKQRRFVDEYLITLNATQAAIKSGYSEKTAQEQSSRLLSNVMVQAAIQERMQDRQKRVEANQDYVITKVLNTIERCSQAESVLDREGNPIGEYKFDSTGVFKGCDMLARHLGMYTDNINLNAKIEHDGANKLAERLASIIAATKTQDS